MNVNQANEISIQSARIRGNAANAILATQEAGKQADYIKSLEKTVYILHNMGIDLSKLVAGRSHAALTLTYGRGMADGLAYLSTAEESLRARGEARLDNFTDTSTEIKAYHALQQIETTARAASELSGNDEVRMLMLDVMDRSADLYECFYSL